MKLIFSGNISSDVRTDRHSQTLGLPYPQLTKVQEKYLAPYFPVISFRLSCCH